MRKSLTKHHLLWGGLSVIIILAGLASFQMIYYVIGGLPNGAGAMIGAGRGALFLGLTFDKAPVGFDYGAERTLDGPEDNFYYWFALEEDGSILAIPLWVVLLIPVLLWVLSTRRLRVER